MPPPVPVVPARAEIAFRNAALRCGSCGGPAEAGSSHCPACGAALAGGEAPGETAASPLTAGFACKSCGATVACEPGRGSYACAFCGSTYVVELPGEGLARLVPEFVLPFRIDREEAGRIFARWSRGDFFTPGDVRAASRVDRLQGVYLPFWTFSMRAESTWEADIGEHWWETVSETVTDSQGKKTTRTRQVRHTEWHPLRGRHHSFHAHHLTSGSTGLPQGEAEGVFPFELIEMRRYRPHLLAGWLAEAFSVPREDALAACQQAFTEEEGRRIAEFLPGDTHKGLEWTTTFSEVADDLLLLPFWIGAYTYKGKVYRFVLNGQTGRATGTRPMSPWKIAAVLLVVLALLAVLVFFVLKRP
jgi:hypothetical protein